MGCVLQWQVSERLESSLTVPRIVNITFIISVTFGTAILMIMTLMLVIHLLSVRWQHIEVMGMYPTPCKTQRED
jgi:hypothetical protein